MRVRRPPHPQGGPAARPRHLSSGSGAAGHGGSGPDDGERRAAGRSLPRLDGLLGEGSGAALARLGPPAADRVTGSERWLRYEGDGWSLRLRLTGSAEGERVASWTLGLDPGVATLGSAARSAGLWPAAAPDVPAGEVEEPMVRRVLPDPAGGPDRSLTASVRGGRFVALTAFDEPPDWL